METHGELPEGRFLGRLGTFWLLWSREKLQNRGRQNATQQQFCSGDGGGKPLFADAERLWRTERQNANDYVVGVAFR